MDPIAKSQWLVRWQEADLSVEASADPSLRQLRENLLRMESLFRKQSMETQSHLKQEAELLSAALREGKADIRFDLPEVVVCPEGRDGEDFRAVVPADFRRQRIAGFLNRFPVKDIRAAFRSRISQLENSGYFGVQIGAGLLRFTVAREIVRNLRPEETLAGVPWGIIDSDLDFPSPRDGETLRSCAAPEDPAETEILKNAEQGMLRIRSGIGSLHQAVSLAPYLYADREYQAKRTILWNRLVSLGHGLAYREVRRMVRTIWRRALANELNRGLSLSVPYFDDRSLEMKMRDFEVIPPGRTMFVPTFVALAAVREQEKVEQDGSLSPSARVHLLAELKNLEQAFDSRQQ